MDGLTCVSSSFCLVGDNGGRVLTYNGRSWTKTEVFRGDLVGDISCASRSFCVAVPENGGDTSVGIFNGRVWRRSFVERTNEAGFATVSCVSSSRCVLFDDGGGESTFDGRSWSKRRLVDRHPADVVSCVSRSFCIESGDGDAVTFDGTHWTPPTVIDSADVDSLSCVAGPFCLAVDFQGRVLTYS